MIYQVSLQKPVLNQTGVIEFCSEAQTVVDKT